MRQVMGVYAQQASAHLAKHNLQVKFLTAFAATSHYNPADTSYPSVGLHASMEEIYDCS